MDWLPDHYLGLNSHLTKAVPGGVNQSANAEFEMANTKHVTSIFFILSFHYKILHDLFCTLLVTYFSHYQLSRNVRVNMLQAKNNFLVSPTAYGRLADF